MRRFAVIYLKLLGLTAVLLGAFSLTYVTLNHARLFPAKDEIVIYGRDSCGYTAALREYLDAAGTPYTYANIDRSLIAAELSAQLRLTQARTVRLPVVLVNGEVMERPDQAVVTSLREAALSR